MERKLLKKRKILQNRRFSWLSAYEIYAIICEVINEKARKETYMRYINELREGDNVSDVYLCKVKNIAKTKAGKTYYSMILQDKTGVIDTKIWDLNNGIDNFEQMDYIRVEGNITSFQGSLQLNVEDSVKPEKASLPWKIIFLALARVSMACLKNYLIM